jgi:hypothetical protein
MNGLDLNNSSAKFLSGGDESHIYFAEQFGGFVVCLVFSQHGPESASDGWLKCLDFVYEKHAPMIIATDTSVARLAGNFLQLVSYMPVNNETWAVAKL